MFSSRIISHRCATGWYFIVALVVSIWVPDTPAVGQLRICTFNTLSKPANATDDAQLRTIVSAIAGRSVNGIAKRPDIIALQEQDSVLDTTNSAAADLNSEFGINFYQSIMLSSGSFRQAYVYDSSVVTPISSSEFFIGIRVALRTQWQLVGYDAGSTFYTYCVHFKAGDSVGDLYLRNSEATNLRADADALGPGAHVIYMGDFNFAGHDEDSVLTMYSAGNAQAYDPVALPTWPNLTSRHYLSQSTRLNALPDGGAFGGIDDRFDLQLISDAMLDGEGISYLGPTSTGFVGAHSYHAFGNDGLVYNGAINGFYNGREQPAVVLDALHDFSDHLPVIADYQFPARMQVIADPSPISAVQGSLVPISFSVENTAPVTAAIAADELDYDFGTTGDLTGSGVGTADALAGAQSKSVSLDTTSLGSRTAALTVMTFSQQAAGATFVENYSFFVTVLGDMNGDFVVDNFDISPFADALLDPAAYAASFPMIDPDVIGDFNGNGELDNFDIDGFADELINP
ncbi:Endonuclease/Exonuclease/phosphatase family protein [Stieleria neptunia]|uniref:Endonuclease/Exonuclease/phosphatase family protein n=1 Tax=Stieleria neptunia TaxID=2527979 RepID=A0A518HN57_9BACT|nr:endonuclease/exonuclease/phosphatase family protein [Stieleria neptunia]QDV42286.1 Endonuclease/Exonuclease/phosphatase family protein [Stieleria neptunia]